MRERLTGFRWRKSCGLHLPSSSLRRACILGCTLQEPYGETTGWGKDGRMLGRYLRS